MKATLRPYRPVILLIIFLSFYYKNSNAQGKVVINEYMPWTPSACGASAEFVELLNFGPGPVNIGCYILTDGDYSITIPANTILQPGEFYVLSGMDIIAYPCANIDSTIHSDLNWTTCGCTSAPIPTTGDGFMTDGGSANEQLVLMDPGLNVIDAVVRSLPVESSSLIVTSTVGGNCLPGIFDLDLMSINYETIGESAGRGNSFARRLDGDCGWVKDPQQSGNATNNTPGDVSDVSYSFHYLKSIACPDDGSIAVTVHASSYGNIFPMTYTLAFDSDDDGVFEITDTYTNGVENNPNTISISNLVPGTYRLTVASVKGCYLQTFPFVILDCIDILPVKLISFTVEHKIKPEISCNWSIENCEELTAVTIERSKDGILFSPWQQVEIPAGQTGLWNGSYKFNEEEITKPFFRLALKNSTGNTIYSEIIQLSTSRVSAAKVWPNPVKDMFFVTDEFESPVVAEAVICNTNTACIRQSFKYLQRGSNQLSFPVKDLKPGYYGLVLRTLQGQVLRTYIFVKL